MRPFEPDSVKFSPQRIKDEYKTMPKLNLKLERIESADSYAE